MENSCFNKPCFSALSHYFVSCYLLLLRVGKDYTIGLYTRLYLQYNEGSFCSPLPPPPINLNVNISFPTAFAATKILAVTNFMK